MELEQSRFLIVVCSPESAKSAWVNREVEHFIELNKFNYVIPYIISGRVGGGELECFPPILRSPPKYCDHPYLDLSIPRQRLENEKIKAYLKSQLANKTQIVGVSLGKGGQMLAYAKIAAKMFGLDPRVIIDTDFIKGELEAELQKELEEKRSRRSWQLTFALLGLSVMALILTALCLYLYHIPTGDQDPLWTVRELIDNGDALLMDGNTSKAKENYENALEIIRQRTTNDQSNDRWQYQLATVLVKIGNILKDNDDKSGALKYFEEALGICQSLAKMKPSIIYYEAKRKECADNISHLL